MLHIGSCHCENIAIEFSSDITPSEIETRECQCDFCRKHGTKAVTDPNGKLNITVKDIDNLSRYSFGLKTADYLVCKRCGVYVAAITKDELVFHGIAIVNAFQNRNDFYAPPIPAVYDDEDETARRERRRSNWTPTQLLIQENE